MIAHGNGPQVGKNSLSFLRKRVNLQKMSCRFPECTAMSQGYIGYHLQQAIDEELVARNLGGTTSCYVNYTSRGGSERPSVYKNQQKPIGGYYDEETAKQLMAETGNVYQEDAGRGWRRVVPSPKPVDIYEKVSLRTLVDAGQIVIACGGGGVPYCL